MKQILTHQFDEVSGGWADQDGSGIKSASNGGSSSGGSGGSGGSSLLDRTIAAYYNSPYGSGASASGFFGTSSSGTAGNLSGIKGAPNAGGNGNH